MKEINNLLDYYMMQQKNRFCQEHSMGNVKLELTLHVDNQHTVKADFNIGRDNRTMQEIKNIVKFIDDIKFQQMSVYSHGLAFVHSQGAFERESLPLVKFLLDFYQDSIYTKGDSSFFCPEDRAKLIISGKSLDKIIRMYEGRKIRFEKEFDITELDVINDSEGPAINIDINSWCSGIVIVMEDFLWLDGENRGYAVFSKSIRVFEGEFYDDMKEFMRVMGQDWNSRCTVKEEEMSIFADTLLPVLEKYTKVETDIDFHNYHPEHPQFAIYIDYVKKGSRASDSIVTGKVEAIYEKGIINPVKNIDSNELFRNVQDEFQIKTLMEAYLPKITSDKRMYYLEHDDAKLLMLINEGIERLRESADVYVTDAFRNIKIIYKQNVSAGVSVKSNLLEVTWNIDGMSMDEVNEIIESYNLKKNYYRLKSGDFIKIADDGLMLLSKLKDKLMINDAQMSSGSVNIPLYRAMYLNSVFEEDSGKITVYKNDEFSKIIEKMESFDESEINIPQNINASLRPYQNTGFRWMYTLSKLGFGGILADDMGLGKTLQVLTFLRSVREGTSLVVCPASLVYNWENECRKFVPDMKVMTLAGNADEREAMIADYEKYDIVITSYDLLKRDSNLFEGKYFANQIIDEAQYIKNASTQAAKAVKNINSGCRFALTGTPIENRLSELWSIFEYLMPGYLFTYKHFKEEYEMKIVQMNDNEALTSLHNMIKPFILRRLKCDVLSDLPEKLEEVVYSRMNSEQEKLYKAHEKQLITSLTVSTEQEVKTGKIEILAQLTKMRQICCDPALLFDDYKDGSAKFDTCIELVINAVNAEHKILVFSQFAKMLERINRRLNKEGIRTYILTGETSKTERNRLVKSFQDGEADVFLISLKAGGTGLNLTAADIVIHYDPWWNIAAQNQASDRAHRIGQNNKVSIFKLIARDTIEERILELQEQKKELADNIISEGGISVSSLCKGDLLALFE